MSNTDREIYLEILLRLEGAPVDANVQPWEEWSPWGDGGMAMYRPHTDETREAREMRDEAVRNAHSHHPGEKPYRDNSLSLHVTSPTTKRTPAQDVTS